MRVLKIAAVPWLVAAVVLIAVGLFVLDGGIGAIVLAVGFVAAFGAAITVISSRDPRPPEERRLPAGHSGI